MKISGIYQIQSKIKPERIYIGSAVNINRRWVDHLTRLKRNIHENSKIQRHFNKYGKNDFIFSILIGCDKADLISTEQFFIDSLNPWFNVRKIADSNLGIKKQPHTEEAKEKMRKANLGKIPWNKGKKGIYSDATLKLMSNGRKNKSHSEETKQKMREKSILNKSGDRLPSFKGTHYSEERKQQCRDVWVKRKLNKICVN
jgi:group I intron endonuclease